MSSTATITVQSIAASKSAGAIKNKANYIEAKTRDLEDAQAHKETAASLSNLQDQVNIHSRNLRVVASAIANGTAIGPAGGDLAGTYPDPSVVKLQGNAVQNAAPANGDLLTWVAVNNQWEPVAPSVSPGAATVDYHAITANTTISASVSPAPVNGLLVVILKFNATPGWTISWNAADFLIAPTGLSSLANTYTAVMFAAEPNSAKWIMVAPPMTGRT
jgi:hypothetical protein